VSFVPVVATLLNYLPIGQRKRERQEACWREDVGKDARMLGIMSS
jgi:hypothetical protein